MRRVPTTIIRRLTVLISLLAAVPAVAPTAASATAPAAKPWRVVDRYAPAAFDVTAVVGGYGWGAWELESRTSAPNRIGVLAPDGTSRPLTVAGNATASSPQLVRAAEPGKRSRVAVLATVCHRKPSSCALAAVDPRSGAVRHPSWLAALRPDPKAVRADGRAIEDRDLARVTAGFPGTDESFGSCETTVRSLDTGAVRVLPRIPDCDPRRLILRDGVVVLSSEQPSKEGDRSHTYAVRALDLGVAAPTWTVVGRSESNACGSFGARNADVVDGDVVVLERHDSYGSELCDGDQASWRSQLVRQPRGLLVGAPGLAPVTARTPFQGLDGVASRGADLIGARVFSTGNGKRQRFHGEIRRFAAP